MLEQFLPEEQDEALRDPSQDAANAKAADAQHGKGGPEDGSLPYPVVAIGGSAGGVEAYIELFSHLPAGTGMAFVVISHLAPGHKSHLVEILAARAAIPVSVIEDGARVEPDRIYVLPPDKIVTITGGVLALEPRSKQRPNMVIDEFFRSLAADQKNRAIGVVLSGMDSDGALGLKAIKGEGGIAIVQAPESARFPSMPRSSIVGDHIDLVVPPADIGLELARIGSCYLRSDLKALEQGRAPEGQEQQFTRILNLLSGVSNVDFRGYKPATLQRRVARRMLLKRFETLTEYLRYLQVHGEELRELHEDVLVGFTRFFRDPEVFSVLKSDILPRIFEGRETGQQVRVWIAGCSTGEEVYSIAISLLEQLTAEAVEPPIQIFGTDASDSSVQIARLGIYPESIATEISPERMRRFFVKVDKGYQVSKRVRDLCIFARQNLCSDPPFGRLDLISCRNVLIYLGPELQKRIFTTFHYGLQPDGFLLLGNSETIPAAIDGFSPLDRKHKIYVKVPSSAAPHFGAQHTFTPLGGSGKRLLGEPVIPSQNAWTDMDLQRAADRIVLARYGPPGVIVNERLEILQSRGHTAPFLELAQGNSSLHLLRMAREGIAAQVDEAVQRAIEHGIAIHIPKLMNGDGGDLANTALEVLPIHTASNQTRAFLVLFPRTSLSAEPGAQVLVVPERASHHEKNELATQIDSDLAATKVYLQSLIEERDARNQELVSANEEIQSANEEMQSANEELETTKEELQSANEELQTVNEELTQRNYILAQTGNDLTNLLNSVNLPLLMLNNDLQIRQFTPLTQRLMNIRSSDIGRPISEIRLNLSIEDLEPVLLDVLETLGTRELEVQDRDGHWRLMRVRPYRTSDNKIEGVVVVLVDIDEQRRSQQELRDARDYARAVIESVRMPIVVLSMDLRIRTMNSAFQALAHLPPRDLEQRSFPDLVTLLWHMEDIKPQLNELALHKREGEFFEKEHEFGPGQEKRVFRIWGRTMFTDGDQVILLTLEDITAQRVAEQLKQHLNDDLESRIQATQQSLVRTQSELRALAASLFTSQEEERRRVARELHDDVTQQLAHLQMAMDSMMMNPPEAREELITTMRQLSQRTSNLSDSVRDISHSLHPAILDDLGLAQALKSLIDEFRIREAMPATFRQEDIPDPLPMKTAGALYRITQEALRNITKHAGKTHVKVTLKGTGDSLQLEVRDSGDGFDSEEKRKGLGLVSMAERARLVNGSLSVESELGKGTTVRVDVPLRFAQEA